MHLLSEENAAQISEKKLTEICSFQNDVTFAPVKNDTGCSTVG